MTLWRTTVQAPWMWWLGLAVSGAILGGVIYSQSGPRRVRADTGPVALDVLGGPCHPSTWETACRDWMAAGWPPCTLSPDGVPVVELTPALASLAPREHLRGAVVEIDGVRSVAIAPDACSTPAPLHELGHLYGLGHGVAAGDVMASPSNRTGWRVPVYGGAP